MPKAKRRRAAYEPPKLILKQVLAWADAHRARTGEWPGVLSGPVKDNLNENWRKIDNALRYGLRGLPGGSSLPKLLARHRGARNPKALPPLSERMILFWADLHHELYQEWPDVNDGEVLTAKGETWRGIDAVLRDGFRGLPGRSSLAQLLEARRGVLNRLNALRLTPELILKWADAHFARTGSWPNRDFGVIPESPGDTWRNIEDALRQKGRGLRGVSSLARLLAKYRGIRNHMDLPRLTLTKILGWADAHFQRNGKWPTIEAGPIAEAEGGTWKAVQMALVQGLRGLKGGDSLARLLLRCRGVPRRGRH